VGCVAALELGTGGPIDVGEAARALIAVPADALGAAVIGDGTGAAQVRAAAAAEGRRGPGLRGDENQPAFAAGGARRGWRLLRGGGRGGGRRPGRAGVARAAVDGARAALRPDLLAPDPVRVVDALAERVGGEEACLDL